MSNPNLSPTSVVSTASGPCAPSNGARSSRGCPVSRSPNQTSTMSLMRTMNTRPRKILGWKTSTEVFGLAT